MVLLKSLNDTAAPRVAVFRALMLGDLLCATPALRALRAALPKARIALIGLAGTRELARRLPSVDEFIAFPGWPGLPEQGADVPCALAFVAAMRDQGFDLALQCHGSGRIVNPLVAAFGARLNGGFAEPGAWRPDADADRYLQWPARGSEVERLLALTDHLGCPRQGTQLDFPLRSADRERAARLRAGRAGSPGGRYAVVHAGAQWASRRWPAERFGAVADSLCEQGLAVVLTGTAGEAALTQCVAAAMHHPALDLAGLTDLWTLGALVEGAELVVCNDTGVSHVAAALGTPSVVVANGSEVARWAPADAARHRVLWHDLPCRPCSDPVCPHGQACALAVPVDGVARAAAAALAGRGLHG